jgi:hypothetical protein
MEFVEAPAFTRHLRRYLDDDDYKNLQIRLAANPDVGDLCRAQADFESCAGPMRGGAKEEGAGCGLFIITSLPIIRYG